MQKKLIDVLCNTILTPIGVSLKSMIEEGNDVVIYHTGDKAEQLVLMFSVDSNGDSILCKFPTRLFIVGVLKFYTQMLGRENMSSSRCI